MGSLFKSQLQKLRKSCAGIAGFKSKAPKSETNSQLSDPDQSLGATPKPIHFVPLESTQNYISRDEKVSQA